MCISILNFKLQFYILLFEFLINKTILYLSQLLSSTP